MNVQEMVSLLMLRLGDKSNRSLSKVQYTTEMNDAQNSLVKLIPFNHLKSLYTRAQIKKAAGADWSTSNNFFDLEQLRTDRDTGASTNQVDRVVDEGVTRELIDLVYVIGKKTGVGFDASGERFYKIIPAKDLESTRGTMLEGDSNRPTVSLQWGANGRGLYFYPNPEAGETIHVCYLGAPRDMEYSITLTSADEVVGVPGRYIVVVPTMKRQWPGYYNGMYIYDYETKARYRILDSYFDGTDHVLDISTLGDYTGINEIAANDVISIESEFPEYLQDLIVDYTESQRWGILKDSTRQQLVYKRIVDKINAIGGNLSGHDSEQPS